MVIERLTARRMTTTHPRQMERKADAPINLAYEQSVANLLVLLTVRDSDILSHFPDTLLHSRNPNRYGHLCCDYHHHHHIHNLPQNNIKQHTKLMEDFLASITNACTTTTITTTSYTTTTTMTATTYTTITTTYTTTIPQNNIKHHTKLVEDFVACIKSKSTVAVADLQSEHGCVGASVGALVGVAVGASVGVA